MGFWDRLVAHRLTPTVAKANQCRKLAGIPEVLPILLGNDHGSWKSSKAAAKT